MKRRLNWGILGTGAIAGALASAVRQSETGELLAVGSRSGDASHAFGERFGVTRCYPTYDALLADPDVEVVYIATPHPMHAAWAIRAAASGKHVLCEKPAAVNHPELMAMVEAARCHGVFFMEAFMYRCHPQTARLVDLIRSGAIGDVQLIQASFGFRARFDPSRRLFSNALAGGGILDVGCYTVSMARLVAGAAVGQPFADPVRVQGTAHIGSTGVDEWATASLGFASGILAQVTCGVGLSLGREVRVTGTEGQIVLPHPWQADRENAQAGVIHLQRCGSKAVEELVVPADRTSFVYEVDAVGRAVAESRCEALPPAMTWADSEGNMKALDAWRQSVGLSYEMEKPGRVGTVSGLPLQVAREDSAMEYGVVSGVAQPVSRLVMGCDNQPSYPHACVMFDDFFERGGNCFDTAYGYGNGRYEMYLGSWIQDRGVRSDVVLIGKGAHTPYCLPDVVSVELAQSLERLQTDHVDIYFLHRDNPSVPVGEFVEALNRELHDGRLRAFGGSNWSLDRIAQANAYAREHGLVGFSAVSNNFSLARMVSPVWAGCISASDAASRSWLGQQQLPLFAWSSQARGFFTERAHPELRDDSQLVRCWYADDNFARKARVEDLARQKGVHPINIALAYVLRQSFPTFALIGPRVLHETASSCAGLMVDLTAAERAWLNLEQESPA